jgi:hypothetical protein
VSGAPREGAPAGLTDAGLRRLALDLAPLAALDSIAGLVARYRDPRERPGTGGEQRDAAAALDAASDRGALTAARVAWERYVRLTPDVQRTAWWLAQRGGAVRDGAIVSVAEWATVYGRLEGPRSVAEAAERAAVLESTAGTRLRGLKHKAARGRLDAHGAAEIDGARLAEEQARVVRVAAQETLATWGLRRLTDLWVEWRSL